jgi:hypothetical protein
MVVETMEIENNFVPYLIVWLHQTKSYTFFFKNYKNTGEMIEKSILKLSLLSKNNKLFYIHNFGLQPS